MVLVQEGVIGFNILNNKAENIFLLIRSTKTKQEIQKLNIKRLLFLTNLEITHLFY